MSRNVPQIVTIQQEEKADRRKSGVIQTAVPSGGRKL
jgi:hypothetical protein